MNSSEIRRRSSVFAAAVAVCLSSACYGEEDITELESLLSTPVYGASKYQQNAADAPAAISIISQGEIRAFGWRTFAEIMDAIRGIYTRYDRAYAYIGVRGLGRPGDYSSRLLVLVDGVRLNDNIYDAILAGTEFPLDVDLIDRVEFIPGPGSAVHGSNAVLGTVNVITRSAANIRGKNVAAAVDTLHGWKLSGSSASEFSSGAVLAAVSFETSPGQTLAFPEFDSPATPGGVVSGMDGESAIRAFLRFDSDSFSASGLASRRSKEIPNAPYGMVFGDPAAVWVDSFGMIGLTWHPAKVDGEGWYAQTGVANYKYGDYSRYEPDQELIRYENLGVWWHGELNRTVRIMRRNLVLVGVEVQRDIVQEISGQQLEPTLEPVNAVNDKGTRIGLYANDDLQMGANWRLGAGIRLDRNARQVWTSTPRLSLLWHPSETLVVKGLLGRAYRDPNFYERAPPGLDSAWNEELERERVTSSELATDWRASERVRISASIYKTRVTKMLEQVIDPDTGSVDYSNVGSADVRGVEIESEFLAQQGLRIRSSISRQHGTDSAGTDLSNSPRWLFKLHATVPLVVAPLRAALELQGRSSRITETGNRLSPQLVSNFSLAWNSAGHPWAASLTVRNLFNIRTYDPTSTEYLGDRVEQNGREATLQIHFNF